eukprot:CAMPEP_0175806916 /NCGR_PEP_ID=MMETSP0107_2-20121207/1445_1 /TAXON_ID=195067 ORGANISM="Goniomonas pacifica, Strain CCMP1869" /NCGR_SAMPLE_ID=MMETSP0107_2 /ASSEMBLY_ACC=CAM_ASM_000203 /LENGTH=41 /DNA_ID= /DNA_START= /DNA_END= /DNA_ORIENTATION=
MTTHLLRTQLLTSTIQSTCEAPRSLRALALSNLRASPRQHL